MQLRSIATIGLAAMFTFAGAHASAASGPAAATAKASLERLQIEIAKLQKTLETAHRNYATGQHALESADREIQTTTLRLRELESDHKAHQREMVRLNDERRSYLRSLQRHRLALTQQARAAYRLGRESRLKLLLNQDSPARLSRMLAYYDYFARAQTQQISELKKALLTLDQMQAKINTELSALKAVQSKQRTVLDDMQTQRAERRRIVAKLAAQIDGDKARLAELQSNRRNLEALVQKLTNVLADIPADLGQRLGPGQLKGKLPLPLKGRIKHAFGQPRTAGLHWQGWLVAAATGSEVKSIAYGRVAFSDWLRGYGLLMIIDHGDGFMSLYGNNESLLHEVGDWVEPGAAICTVGDSPANGTGLYFELRRNGKAVDPAVWLHR